MKKLLLCFLLLCTPVFAQQATVNQVQKDVNDMCSSIIDTKHSTIDVFVCLNNAFSNPIVWKDGWSRKVNTDVIKVMAVQGAFTDTLTIQEERAYAPLTQQQMTMLFQQYITQFRQYPEYTKPLTPELVQKFK